MARTGLLAQQCWPFPTTKRTYCLVCPYHRCLRGASMLRLTFGCLCLAADKQLIQYTTCPLLAFPGRLLPAARRHAPGARPGLGAASPWGAAPPGDRGGGGGGGGAADQELADPPGAANWGGGQRGHPVLPVRIEPGGAWHGPLAAGGRKGTGGGGGGKLRTNLRTNLCIYSSKWWCIYFASIFSGTFLSQSSEYDIPHRKSSPAERRRFSRPRADSTVAEFFFPPKGSRRRRSVERNGFVNSVREGLQLSLLFKDIEVPVSYGLCETSVFRVLSSPALYH